MANLRKTGLVAAILSAALALAIPSLPAAAQEQPAPAPLPGAQQPWNDGFYFLLDFSIGDTKNPGTDADFGVDLDWSTGFGLGFGYRLGPVRLEAEFSDHFYRVGSLDLGPAAPFPTADYAGGMEAANGLANVLVDLPLTGRMRPYLGAGMGIARVDANYNESVCIIYCFSTSNEVVNDWDRVLAWQAMGGLSFSRGSGDVEWFIGYRYYETQDLNLRTLSGVAFNQDGLKDHSVMAGFRFLIN